MVVFVWVWCDCVGVVMWWCDCVCGDVVVLCMCYDGVSDAVLCVRVMWLYDGVVVWLVCVYGVV